MRVKTDVPHGAICFYINIPVLHCVFCPLLFVTPGKLCQYLELPAGQLNYYIVGAEMTNYQSLSPNIKRLFRQCVWSSRGECLFALPAQKMSWWAGVRRGVCSGRMANQSSSNESHPTLWSVCGYCVARARKSDTPAAFYVRGRGERRAKSVCLCVRAGASSTVGLLYGGSGAGRSFKWPSITHLRACSHQKPLHPN
jgi:hypothetical protein